MIRAHPESQIQRAIVTALRLRGLTVFAIPNGGARRRVEAAIMRGEGVLPGVPDLCVPGPSGRTTWLEVKAPKGRVTELQDQMHARLRMLGHRVEIVRSVDEALAVFA